jgi:hypothetical protein
MGTDTKNWKFEKEQALFEFNFESGKFIIKLRFFDLSQCLPGKLV